jgi:hypothetical protein
VTEVLVGHFAVGDARVDQRHSQRFVAEQRGDRFEAHPTVDTGGEGVAQLVRVDVAESGGAGDTANDPADVMSVQRSAVIGVQQFA